MPKTVEELERDVEYWKKEAQTAFTDRDKVKEQLRALEGRTLTDAEKQQYDDLKKKQKQIEEDAAKAAGKWDELKQSMEQTHQADLQKANDAAAAATALAHAAIKRSLFGGAVDLFGGHADARTILDVPLALDTLGRYVTVEADPKAADGYKVVVTGPDGRVVEGANRSPLPFADAITKVIEGLPNKDRIFRGGGKAGSGSPGAGGGGGSTIDVGNLKAADFQRPEVRQAVRERQNAGSRIVQGRAFDVLDQQGGKGTK